VVLLSGGLDSATALAEARAAGFEPYALTILYGQRHAIERDAARRVAAALGVVRHVEQAIDLRAFGGSALTAEIAVPKGRPPEEIAAGIVFLAGDDASFVHGAVLAADGGRSAT